MHNCTSFEFYWSATRDIGSTFCVLSANYFVQKMLFRRFFSCWTLFFDTRTLIHTSHASSKKGAVGIDILTGEQLLQLRNSPFSLCRTCNRPNGSQKAALCSVLGTLSTLWMAAEWFQCQCVMTYIQWILLDVQNWCLERKEQRVFI